MLNRSEAYLDTLSAYTAGRQATAGRKAGEAANKVQKTRA